jgi:hypothetical protein
METKNIWHLSYRQGNTALPEVSTDRVIFPDRAGSLPDAGNGGALVVGVHRLARLSLPWRKAILCLERAVPGAMMTIPNAIGCVDG